MLPSTVEEIWRYGCHWVTNCNAEAVFVIRVTAGNTGFWQYGMTYCLIPVSIDGNLVIIRFCLFK